eukprot:Gb_30479 [translate_table: standard]
MVNNASAYVRWPPRATISAPLQTNSDTDPQQGESTSYSYLLYRSGLIHHVLIGPLETNTVYYYRCGGYGPEYSFKTPPANFPITFAVVGDLGQTGWTYSTLQHIQERNHDALLLPGDLSYADYVQPLWDSFGRLVEPLASARPWMVTEGNHDVEKIPLLKRPFKAYNARWRMPFEESASNSNLYYSFEVAGVHIVMLGSYTDYGTDSDQYKWLRGELSGVDRSRIPWLIVLLHAPWYNTNTAIKTRVYKNKVEPCGPIHITIGDGGNREGLASVFQNPQPQLSIFREASFGHGQFVVYNATHAHWSWHRNDNDESVMSDELWINSLGVSTNCAGQYQPKGNSDMANGQ